jgi:hypothetical protein
MTQESATLQSLQVKQQLGIQALSIATSGPAVGPVSQSLTSGITETISKKFKKTMVSPRKVQAPNSGVAL